jgi:hypothetical protein
MLRHPVPRARQHAPVGKELQHPRELQVEGLDDRLRRALIEHVEVA